MTMVIFSVFDQKYPFLEEIFSGKSKFVVGAEI